MAYTQAEIDALKSAAARGVTRGRIGGEEVQFDTLREMRRQIAAMEAELAAAASNGWWTRASISTFRTMTATAPFI